LFSIATVHALQESAESMLAYFGLALVNLVHHIIGE
jgi:hypothetical protein